MPYLSSEHAEQAAFIEWTEANKGRYPVLKFLYAIPNGAKLPYRRNQRGQRYSPEAQKLLREGMKSGVPDLCLPVPRGIYHGLYLETKYGKNDTSDEQKEWIAFLRSQGYFVSVCWGCDELIQQTELYLSQSSPSAH